MPVYGIGDNVVDRYFNRKQMLPRGNAVNFAVNARPRGAYAAYLSVIGTDAEGNLIRASLQAEGVELERLRVEEGPNAYATVHMNDDGNSRKWGLCKKGVSVFRLDCTDRGLRTSSPHRLQTSLNPSSPPGRRC
jgi:fructoselysine 6-kinase